MLRGILRTPLPVVILIASFLAPTELSFYFAGLRLPPHRIALLVLLPFAMRRLLQRSGPRMQVFDAALVTYSVWTVCSFSLHGSGTAGLVFGSSLALESLGAFTIARAYVRSEAQCRATIATLLAAILLAALVALPETLLGRHFTHDALQSVTGYLHPRVIETRMGLVRAYGTFDHPIHLGTFAASLLALAWYSRDRAADRLRATGIVAVATLAAVSSAPILCLLVQAALIVWDYASRRVPHRLGFTLTAIAVGFMLISILATRSPFALIATGFTLDPWTGYYRLLIWEYGLATVLANPVIGIGLNDWSRPEWMYSETVDAFWLLIAMRTGIPGIALLVLAIALLLRAVARRASRCREPNVGLLARGWMMALIALTLAATTVHLWNVLHTYFFFFLGLAGWIADPVKQMAGIPRSADLRSTDLPKRRRRRDRWGTASPATGAGGMLGPAPATPGLA